jgi:hypothetical protein
LNQESEEDQLAAIKQDGCSIFYIKNPSEEVQLLAVLNGYDKTKKLSQPAITIQNYLKNKTRYTTSINKTL